MIRCSRSRSKQSQHCAKKKKKKKGKFTYIFIKKGKQVEKQVPEELSYCRLSGGGPLRHNPIKNGLLLSWTRASMFGVVLDWVRGKGMSFRGRGVWENPRSHSLSQPHNDKSSVSQWEGGYQKLARSDWKWNEGLPWGNPIRPREQHYNLSDCHHQTKQGSKSSSGFLPLVVTLHLSRARLPDSSLLSRIESLCMIDWQGPN